MNKLFLSKDSFICETLGHAVFLDLKSDRYVALPPRAAAQLPGILPALGGSQWFRDCRSGTAGSSEGEPEELARMLQTEGLVVSDESRGKSPLPTTIEMPRETLWNNDGTWPRLNRRHLRNFFSAWARSASMLKLFSLNKIVQRVKVRKERELQQVDQPSLDDLRRIMAIYYLLQPLLLSSENACLQRSLTLVEFLARFGIYPTWVFGVRLQPFAAHCWVQHEKTLLNDSIQQIGTFTPIMTV